MAPSSPPLPLRTVVLLAEIYRTAPGALDHLASGPVGGGSR